jgi:hypothetical protein
MLSPSKRVLQEYKQLIMKMVKTLQLLWLQKSIMRFCVMPKPYSVSLVSCPYWKWCKGCPSLHNDTIHSFATLWLLSSFVKQTYKKCIVNLTPSFPPSILAISLSYLNTSMTSGAWHGGKNLHLKLNMLLNESTLRCHNFNGLKSLFKKNYNVIENWLKIWIFKWYWK